MNEESLFYLAQQQPDAAIRAAFLDEACVNQPQLRSRLEKLLQAHQAPLSLFDKGAGELSTTVDSASGSSSDGGADSFCASSSPAEESGTRIGPYKLLQKIGEGGMGVVWMAEQEQPVRRKVAVKIIKPGMDSRQVIARFEQERQALALMDHVNIARVFDAGTTTNGRPYFVMELIAGVPITTYCDDQQLTPRQRLELFVSMCQAIQHAHQKGIIHRDVKPSNVLVTLSDGQPVPKIIDFGVAKAIEQRLTEQTLCTEHGAIIGTFEYMSPEQAEVSALGVDTRSDIYSLGVLLNELLTGTTPLDRQRLRTASYAEIVRMIREEEPPKPSTRLSHSETLAVVAAARKLEPAKLVKLVRGELDWIVMKALEKDRNSRYETANGLAMDVQRYLNDEAVQACPPSAGYRLRKIARRNKTALGLAGMILFFLLLLGAGAGWVVRDRAARAAEQDQERTQRLANITAQVELIFAEIEQLQTEQKWPEALAAARRAQAVVTGTEADPDTRDRVQQILSDLEMIALLEEIRLGRSELLVNGSLDHAAAARLYAAAFRDYGVDIETLPAEEAATRLRSRPAIAVALAAALDDWCERCRSKRDEEFARRLSNLAASIDTDPWRLRVRFAVDARDVLGLLALAEAADTARQPPQSQLLLARQLWEGNKPQAIALLERALDAHPADFWIHYNLGKLHLNHSRGSLEAAVRYFTAALALRPQSGLVWFDLGLALQFQRKLDKAIACYRKAIELDPKYYMTHYNLGYVLQLQGKLGEAIACYRKANELEPKHTYVHYQLGSALHALRQFDEAVSHYSRALELGASGWRYWYDRGRTYLDLNEPAKALADFSTSLAIHAQSWSVWEHRGRAYAGVGQFDRAIADYGKALELNPTHAPGHSNLAWLLATCPDTKVRDAGRAVTLAQKAVELAPQDGNNWQALGVAQHRAGDCKASIAAFKKSMELRQGGDSFVWFFLAMAHGQLGEKDQARQWYDRAVQWMDNNDPKNDELRRFRRETEELLGVEKKSTNHGFPRSQTPIDNQKYAIGVWQPEKPLRSHGPIVYPQSGNSAEIAAVAREQDDVVRQGYGGDF